MPRHWRLFLLLAVLAATGCSLALVGAAATQPPELRETNLLQNPGFEGPLGNWQVDGLVTIVTTHQHSGCCSASLSRAGSGPASVFQTVALTAGATYNLSGYFYLTSSQSVRSPIIMIDWLGAGGAIVGSETIYCPVSVLAWAECPASRSAPQSADGARISAGVQIKSSGGVAYVDDIGFALSAPPAATATQTQTATPSRTRTASATRPVAITATATGTATVTPTRTLQAVATATRTASAAETATPTMTAGATASETASATVTQTDTATPSMTATATMASDCRECRIFLPLILMQPTPTTTPTATPDPHLVTLNEILPNPYMIDWNGDGEINSDDEWIELYNGAGIGADVSGWALDDEADDGSRFYFLPAGTVIPAHGYLLLFGSETGLNLANTKDVVRLLYRNGMQLEEYRYYATWHDRSFCRTVDGAGDWTIWYPPTPGDANHP